MVLVLAAALLAPSAALAHAILEHSDPPAGGRVAAGPVTIHLTYNSRIDARRSVLTLMRPDRSRATLPVIADGPPNVLTTSADLRPGAYVLRWQVLAVDGHITRGDLPFTVEAR